jgi:hypothetical protein
MTQPTKSVRLRRIGYSQQAQPILPVNYEDPQDAVILDVLDTALAYNGLIGVLGHTWNGAKQLRSDFAAPTVTFSFYPNPAYDSQTMVAVVFAANESNCTFMGRIDGSAYSPVVSPKYYSGIVTGTHTIDVYATDYLGNVGSPASTSWFTTGTV